MCPTPVIALNPDIPKYATSVLIGLGAIVVTCVAVALIPRSAVRFDVTLFQTAPVSLLALLEFQTVNGVAGWLRAGTACTDAEMAHATASF